MILSENTAISLNFHKHYITEVKIMSKETHIKGQGINIQSCISNRLPLPNETTLIRGLARGIDLYNERHFQELLALFKQ